MPGGESQKSKSSVDVGSDEVTIGDTTHGPVNTGDLKMRIILTETIDSVAVRSVTSGVMALHKSCDPCRAGKRKCSGNKPCSRCVQLDEQEFCSYSPLKPRKPYRKNKRNASGVSSRSEAKCSSNSVVLDQRCCRVTLSRCGLSPSPATGLVGTEENTFLGDYFRVGFIPFTTQSRVREAIIRIMTSPVWGVSEPHRTGDRQNSDTVSSLVNSDPCAQSGAPSICIFWCACAIGALAQGCSVKSASEGVVALSLCLDIVEYHRTLDGPITCSSANAPVRVIKPQVSRYARMATDSLRDFCGPDTVESIEACTILAYLSGFRGNEDLFLGYLERADRFLQQRIDAGSVCDISVGFDEIVKHGETIKVLSGRMKDDELKSFCKYSTPHEIDEFTTEGEILRFAMLSYRTFVKAFYSHVSTSFSEPLSKGHEGIPRKGTVTFTRVEQPGGQHQHGFPCVIRNVMLAMMKHFEGGMKRLDQIVDRPIIRDGIGAVLLNGLLIFEKAARGDYDGLVERLGRFSEAYERYPGLCRLLMWTKFETTFPFLAQTGQTLSLLYKFSLVVQLNLGYDLEDRIASRTHITHIVLAIIIATEHPGSRQLYDKLRHAYNHVCLADTPPIPPFEEWRGMSQICDHLYCRTIEEIITSDELAFRPPTSHAQSIDSAEDHQCPQQTPHASLPLGRDASTRDMPKANLALPQEEGGALSIFEAKCVTFSEDPVPTAALPAATVNLTQGQVMTPSISECSCARSWALKDEILSLDSNAFEGPEMMSQMCEFIAMDEASDQHSGGQQALANIPIANAAVSAAAITAGSTMENDKRATTFSPDPDEMHMSEFEPDFDALAAADWLDVTHAMLAEH